MDAQDRFDLSRMAWEEKRERWAEAEEASDRDERTAAALERIADAAERQAAALEAQNAQRQPCDCDELWRLARAFADATEPVQITDTASAIATYVRSHS